ncbi:hypothetical protein DFH07DRAFT_130525 [Mycena maculata]|uniref:Glucose receptor Git3 N-terminal domain-containing protein n=1 Tax=Mycena maculata TaxID=230809 RepID=A0AAD7MVG7_9AGAR|nr:hypothetical protein DFH07DRAFT_130525 [Mycena maculata]
MIDAYIVMAVGILFGKLLSDAKRRRWYLSSALPHAFTPCSLFMSISEKIQVSPQVLLPVAYTSWQAHGITVLVVVSCFSLVAVVGLLTAIALSAFNTRSLPQQHLFLRSHAAAYFISLLICDLIQSIASIMNAQWIRDMAVETGTLCVVQGALKQISDVGLSFWTFVIALHTFCSIFLGIIPRPYLVWMTLIGGWSGIGILAMTGPVLLDTVHRGPFYGISGYWCWITPDYVVERATLDYMFMFMAGTFSFVLYTLVFLRMRGNIVVTGTRVTLRTATSREWLGQQVEDRTMSVARKMLLWVHFVPLGEQSNQLCYRYPVAYTIVILPIAAARFSEWAGNDVPFEVTIFSDVVFLLSGVVNVTLFTTTRRILPSGSVKLPTFRIDKRTISHPQVPAEYRLGSGLSSYDEALGTDAMKSYATVDSTEMEVRLQPLRGPK